MKKILIIHTAFIGDIVLSTPLISQIKKENPDSIIDYLTLPTNKFVLNNNPDLNDIILFDKKGKDKGLKGFLRVLKIIKQNKYDIAIIPHRFIKSILLAKLSGIKDIIGFDVATGSFLLTKKVKYDMSKHEVERLLDLIDYKGEKIPIKIYPTKENELKIKGILNSKGYNEKNNKLVVISAGSQRPEKMWNAKKYSTLINKIIDENKEVYVCITGSRVEKNIDLGDFSEEKRVIDLRGEIDLLEFSALLSMADVVVGNDSSPIHIACGFEKPYVIGIYGKGKRSLGFFPWKERSNVIEDNEKYENNIINIPEKQHKYTKKYYESINEISVERVYKEIIRSF